MLPMICTGLQHQYSIGASQLFLALSQPVSAVRKPRSVKHRAMQNLVYHGCFKGQNFSNGKSTLALSGFIRPVW